MQDIFFSFKSIPTEIKIKRKSLHVKPNKIFKLFLDRTNFSNNEKIDLKNFFFKLQKLNFDKVYTNYLTHPVRLADMYYQNIDNVSLSDIKFILTHNILEINYLEKFKSNLKKKEIKKIKLLTINRNKQNNQNYLNIFYKNIYNHSDELFVFKAFDKLDNALIGNKNLFSDYALNLFEKFIFPKLKKINFSLYLYKKELLNYARNNILTRC